MHEVTAYAILTLKAFLDLLWLESVRAEGIACMQRGKAYLLENRDRWIQGDSLWIEKVAYASETLSQAYCLAAKKVEVPHLMADQGADTIPPQLQRLINKFTGFFIRTPLFRNTPSWQIDLWLLQGFHSVPALKESEMTIFPPMKIENKEEYFNYIPFTWIGCKQINGTGISMNNLRQMMDISMLNFQVDAYMENVLEEGHGKGIDALK